MIYKLPFEKKKEKILVKKESETNQSYGCKPEDRKTEEIINYGVVNIDKCPGPTSHQVSDFVQKILKINKSGHSGTLDPKVTGVLPIALGDATRIVQTLLKAGKEYVALMHLHKEIDEKIVKKKIKGFVGKIKQIPPIKSSVRRIERVRQIYYIDVLEVQGKDVLFRIGCEAGTYIRKFIHDFGEKLKVGAHMAELRRTKAGPFTEETLVTLHDLTDAYYYWKNENNEEYLRKQIQPIENAVKHLPNIWVLDSSVSSVCHGAQLALPGISKLETGIKKDDIVAVLTLKDELICLGSAYMSSEEILKKEKGFAVKTHKVFMKIDVYPKN